MIKRIEHIGFAIENAETAKETFDKILNKSSYKEEEVASQMVNTIFYQLENSKIELLAATDSDSTIAKYINKYKQGMHHIALLVDNLETEMERLTELGFEFIYAEHQLGADNKRINFIHPKKTHGVLIELCEEITNDNTD